MSDQDEERGGGVLLPVVIAMAVSVFVTAVVQWLVTHPKARKRLVQKAAKTWLRVENSTNKGTQALRRRRHAMEEKARQVALKLWTNVEDLTFVAPNHPIPSVSRRLYAHGAWMGAAPALLDDVKWRRILAFLMPDVYRDVLRALGEDVATAAIIPMFENNPVMCAFGSWRASQGAAPVGPPACMEWDLFLSTDLMHAWEGAPGARQRDEAIRKMVDSMIIGHASVTDTVQQQLGVCQWADVRKTPKTEMGGVEPGSWLDLFARALMLAEQEDLAVAIQEMSAQPRRKSDEECLRFTFKDELPPQKAVSVYRDVTGADSLSVILEIKSMGSSPELLKALVGELNRRSIHVDSIGSFTIMDVCGVSEVVQSVDDVTFAGPREILFLHFAGDLQVGCDEGTIQRGQAAMFNGASLLTARVDRGRYVYGVDEVLLDELDGYRQRHKLELGIYVQENDLDADAAALLSNVVGTRTSLFELGFAWGGLDDQVALAAGKGDRRGFGSQGLLRRTGVANTWKKAAGSAGSAAH
jgi:hypothetical protein